MHPAPSRTNSNVDLRPVRSLEADAISAMAGKIWPTAYAGIIPEAQIKHMLDWMYHPAKLKREMEDEGFRYFWISLSGASSGFVGLGPILRGAACALHKFYLLPELHGSGLGSAAMSGLITLLESFGVTSLELRVNRHNTRAIRFYHKHHFGTYAEDCQEIGGGFVMDDYLMRRQISIATPDHCAESGASE